jgi:hypothetical protein
MEHPESRKRTLPDEEDRERMRELEEWEVTELERILSSAEAGIRLTMLVDSGANGEPQLFRVYGLFMIWSMPVGFRRRKDRQQFLEELGVLLQKTGGKTKTRLSAADHPEEYVFMQEDYDGLDEYVRDITGKSIEENLHAKRGKRITENTL